MGLWQNAGKLATNFYASLVVIFILVSHIAPCLARSSNRNEATTDSQYQNAIRLFNEEKYDSAAALLQKNLEEHPDDAHQHLYLGRCYLRSDHFQKALDEFEKARLLQPILINDTARDTAMALVELEQYSKALTWCRDYKTVGASRNLLDKFEQQLQTVVDNDGHSYLQSGYVNCWKLNSNLRVRIICQDKSPKRQFLFRKDVLAALQAWQRASDDGFSFKVVEQGPAEVIFKLLNGPAFLHDGKRVGGYTRRKLADFDMFTSSPGGPGSPLTNEPQPVSKPPEFIRMMRSAEVNVGLPEDRDFLLEVLFHETGHALGLEHSLNYADVMCGEAAEWRRKKLSKNDVQVIKQIYGFRK